MGVLKQPERLSGEDGGLQLFTYSHRKAQFSQKQSRLEEDSKAANMTQPLPFFFFELLALRTVRQ